MVLCKVEFQILTETDKSKLVDGLTRAQMRMNVVLSERVAGCLTAML